MKVEYKNVASIKLIIQSDIYKIRELDGGLEIECNGKIIFSTAKTEDAEERSEMLARILKGV
tara:strand:+ start:2971 stop:3156 length:186 start_codon:yes stop_codon:yes gene_type:complete